MTSILLLSATDKPDSRNAEDALQLQLADAESVAKRITESVLPDVTLFLPNPADYEAISETSHPTLSRLARHGESDELDSHSAVVVIPPHEDSDEPLDLLVAQTLSHFLENEKLCALCSGTTFALRWMLEPDTVGLYKSAHIPDDDKLYEHLNDQLN